MPDPPPPSPLGIGLTLIGALLQSLEIISGNIRFIGETSTLMWWPQNKISYFFYYNFYFLLDYQYQSYTPVFWKLTHTQWVEVQSELTLSANVVFE
jgi:hypothetical protein